MDFSEILGRFSRVSTQPDGGYLAQCPAHGDSRPSLRIWRGEDGKVRLTCRAGCKTEDVIRAAGLRWTDLFDSTGEGNTVPVEKPAIVSGRYTSALALYVQECTARLDADDPWSERARAYVADRFGLDADTAIELGVGVDDTTAMPKFPYLSRAYKAYQRLTVPLYGFDGVPRGLQGRDLTGQCPGRWVSLRNPEGYRWAPYGVFRGQGGYGVTLVTEGPGDALTAVSVGYDAVAVRGASLVASPELVAELAEGLRGTQVIAAGDNDRAGHSFTRRLAEGLAEHGIPVYALEIPEAGDDLTDWRARDPLAFPMRLHRAVKAAKPVKTKADAEEEAVSHALSEATGADIVSRDQGQEAARILAGLIDRYGDSDAMNAHALVAWCDGRIRYARGLGFYVWNGRVWEASATKVRQEIHRMGAALVLAGRVKEARGFTMTNRIDDLMKELEAIPSVEVDADDFDNRPHLLNFRNGTVDLRTGELKPHSKDDLLTHCLGIDYDPDARCPRWEQFLAEIFPENPELVPYMQRLIGYGITGFTDEQCFCVLWGKGANGKSLLTDTLSNVFNAVSRTTPFATFEEKPSGGIPNDIAALRGSRLVMASEGESGKPMSEGILKRVSGKDKLTARFMRQEFFTFTPNFLLFLATNHKPKFKGQDDGLWRRVKLIPFRRFFAPHERDYSLDRKLMAEAEGIAAWAVRGAVAWFRSGLQDPPAITEATREYKETSDPLAGFFPGVLVRDDSAIMNGSDAYNAYRDWCDAEGLPPKEIWSRRAFYDAMEERKVYRKKTNRGIALVGVREANAPSGPAGPGIFGND